MIYQEMALAEGDVVSRRRHPITSQMMDSYDGNWYHQSLLVKEVSTAMISRDDVSPTLDELQKFRDKEEEEEEDDQERDGGDGATRRKKKGGLSDLLDGLGVAGRDREKKINLAKGDTVKVVEGDLKNLMGVVANVDNTTGIVKVIPLHEEIRDTQLDFAASQVSEPKKKSPVLFLSLSPLSSFSLYIYIFICLSLAE